MAKRCNHTFAIINGASDPLGLEVFFLVVSIILYAKLSVPQHLHNACVIKLRPSVVPCKHLLILLEILKQKDGECMSQYPMVGTYALAYLGRLPRRLPCTFPSTCVLWRPFFSLLGYSRSYELLPSTPLLPSFLHGFNSHHWCR